MFGATSDESSIESRPPSRLSHVSGSMRRRPAYLSLLAALIALGNIPARAQSGNGANTGSGDLPASADIVVFVNVLNNQNANIGIAYNSRVKHSIVSEDLRHLLAVTGWSAASGLQISDQSVHPNRPDLYPVTTAAMISLAAAPQIRNGGPELLPYLQVFQRYSHVEVDFITDTPQTDRSSMHVQNSALSVDRISAQEGILRFVATLRDHQGRLPELDWTRMASTRTAGDVSPTKSGLSTESRINPWSIVLVVAGIGFIACACAYSVMLRRAPAGLTARTLTRR